MILLISAVLSNQNFLLLIAYLLRHRSPTAILEIPCERLIGHPRCGFTGGGVSSLGFVLLPILHRNLKTPKL